MLASNFGFEISFARRCIFGVILFTPFRRARERGRRRRLKFYLDNFPRPSRSYLRRSSRETSVTHANRMQINITKKRKKTQKTETTR